VSDATKQSKTINNVISGVFELHLLTNDYLLHHEERAVKQWHLRHASLAQLLTSVGTEDPKEQVLLDEIMQSHAGLHPLFSRLVANYESRNLSEEEIALSLGVERRLAGQLSVEGQRMVGDTSRLADMISGRIEVARRRGVFLVLVLSGIVTALELSMIALASNRIVTGIMKLHQGAETISAGDLNYQLVVESRDEIGELALAFNKMTHQLRESYGVLKEEITERKRAEEALREYSERLGEMVEERTNELRDAQEQLVRREKLAVLGQLAGGLGHELRNPLGVISNAVYFLQMVLPDASETTREYLGIIGAEIRNAEKIVSDLLDLSRTRPAEQEEAALSDLVAEVLDKQPPPEGVAVTTQIATDLPSVFVDNLQMKQVLANLITNAYQAMPDGGDLVLSARGDGNRVYLSVADTGCGISQENLGKIFEPLFTTRARGIGLGLAVSRNLVQVNGGTIEVESVEGQGSTFTVVLPARKVGL
jgi:signal transduction histidine kinase